MSCTALDLLILNLCSWTALNTRVISKIFGFSIILTGETFTGASCFFKIDSYRLIFGFPSIYFVIFKGDLGIINFYLASSLALYLFSSCAKISKYSWSNFCTTGYNSILILNLLFNSSISAFTESLSWLWNIALLLDYGRLNAGKLSKNDLGVIASVLFY